MALSVCVLHHVPPTEWLQFLSEMQRVVRPGGLVSLIEHNRINPATQLSVARCPFDVDAVLVGGRKMDAMFRAIGLKDISRRYFVFFPSKLARLRTLEKRLSWLSLGAQYLAFGKV
jgi:SAM-dependent methyltransferase